jgi:hypothetical protein
LPGVHGLRDLGGEHGGRQTRGDDEGGAHSWSYTGERPAAKALVT